MYAVLESGGKQYHVKAGNVIKVEKLDGEVGTDVIFDKVLSVGNKIGVPFVKDAVVRAEVLEQCKTDKVIIFKKKRRQNYRRKQGHRQNISVLRIKEIKE